MTLNEREAFEAWILQESPQMGWELSLKTDGEYDSAALSWAWAAWQKKAKAQAVPDTHLLIPKKPLLDITVWLLCQKDIGDNLSQAEYFYEELIEKFIEASESGAEG